MPNYQNTDFSVCIRERATLKAACESRAQYFQNMFKRAWAFWTHEWQQARIDVGQAARSG